MIKQIHAFHKLLKILQPIFNYPYLELIPKFHRTLVRFRTVAVGCNTYRNNANKILLYVLKQFYDFTLNTNNTHCLKNSYQLIEYNILNDLFQKYFTNLKLTKNIDIGFFKNLTNFIINNN